MKAVIHYRNWAHGRREVKFRFRSGMYRIKKSLVLVRMILIKFKHTLKFTNNKRALANQKCLNNKETIGWKLSQDVLIPSRAQVCDIV